MFPLMRDRPIAMPQITATVPPHKIPCQKWIASYDSRKEVAQNPLHFSRREQFTNVIIPSFIELSDTETTSLL
jgi:hypothetical protein